MAQFALVDNFGMIYWLGAKRNQISGFEKGMQLFIVTMIHGAGSLVNHLQLGAVREQGVGWISIGVWSDNEVVANLKTEVSSGLCSPSHDHYFWTGPALKLMQSYRSFPPSSSFFKDRTSSKYLWSCIRFLIFKKILSHVSFCGPVTKSQSILSSFQVENKRGLNVLASFWIETAARLQG